jgi:hypothetical protein
VVEHDLAKVGVAGSNPVVSSRVPAPDPGPAFLLQMFVLLHWRCGRVVRQGTANPSTPVQFRAPPQIIRFVAFGLCEAP